MSTDFFSTPDEATGEVRSGDTVAKGRTTIVNGQYKLPPIPGSKSTRTMFTRATTLAKSISDTYTLSLWQQRCVAVGLAKSPDLLAMAAAHPDIREDREVLNEICEDAKNRANAKVRANLGTALHAFTERSDRGELEPDLKDVPAAHRGEVLIWRDIMARYGLEIPGHLIERVIVHPDLAVAGKFDRIARTTKDLEVPMPGGYSRVIPAGSWVVVDLKTGRDLEYGWNEIAIQLALYARAPLMWDWADGYENMPPVRQDTALVVHLPIGERRGTVHGVDIGQGWEGVQLCAQVRKWRANRTLASVVEVVEADRAAIRAAEAPPRASAEALEAVISDCVERTAEAAGVPTELLDPGPLPPPVTAVRPPTLQERIRAASSIGELAALWYEHRAAGTWTQAHGTAATHRAKKLQTP